MAEPLGVKQLYDTIEDLPEGVIGELINGQLHTQPRPSARHGLAESNLTADLVGRYSRGRGGPGGWWIIVEPELHLVRNQEVLVPDLAAWRRERLPELPDDQRFEVVPDWVCEILSPATASKDRQVKMPVYARYGVSYAWIVDPETATLEAHTLEGDTWRQLVTYGGEDVVDAPPFPEAGFRVADLWR